MDVATTGGTGAPMDRATFVGFGAAQLMRSVLWHCSELLLAFHMVENLGMSGLVVGTVLSISMAISALPDVMIATWLGGGANPARRMLRFQAVFGTLAFLSAMLLFDTSLGHTRWAVAYICAISILFRLTYAICDVSQNALISLLPERRPHLRHYTANKIFASAAGRLVAALIAFLALQAPVAGLSTFQAVAFVTPPGIAALLSLTLFSKPPGREQAERVPIRWRGLPWHALALPIVATVSEVGLLGLVTRLLPLFGSDRPGFADGSLLVVAMVVGTLAGPALPALMRAARRNHLLAVAAVSAVSTLSGLIVLFPIGAAAGVASMFVYGFMMSGITAMIWESVAEVVTDHAAATRERIDAVAFALITTAIKMSIALSSLLFGIVIDGFRARADWAVAMIVVVMVLGGIGNWLIFARPQPVAGRLRPTAPGAPR